MTTKKHLIAALALAVTLPIASAELLVYEPFYYQPINDEVEGRLEGKTGGLGWDGAWVDSPNTVGTNDYAFVYDSRGNLPELYDGLFGSGRPNWDGVVNNFPTVGGYIGLSPWSNQAINQARLNSYRTLTQSAGEMAGEDGVLWMTMVVHYVNANFQNRPGLALTDGGYFNDRAQTLNSGNGIGIGAGEQWPTGQLNAVIWSNDDGTSNVRTVGPNISSATVDSIIVVKLEFGPDQDTVSTLAFTENQTSDSEIFNEAYFHANAVSVTGDIDESTLTTLTFSMNLQENAIDEIRIGTTFNSVLTLPAPGPFNPAASRVSASPAFVPADGTTPSTVTVTLTDSLGIPLSGKEVTLADASGVAVIAPATAVVTDANGQATFNVTSTTGGTIEFTATNQTDSQVITQTATVSFPSTADATLSTLIASATSIVADGVRSAAITITLNDANGLPVAGKEVTLSGNPGSAVIGPAEPLTTNSSGQVVFAVSSTTLGPVEFTATETGDSVVINQTATVDFVDPDQLFAFNVNFWTFTPPAQGPFFPPAESELFGPAGGFETRWNQFNAASGSNLLDPSGVLTGVSFTTNFTEGRAGGAANTPMLQSTLTDFGRGAARTFTISGLPEGAIYDVWLASYRGSTAANERTYGRWTANNPTASDTVQFIDNRDGQNGTTFEEGYNFVVFQSVLVDANGQISFAGKGMMLADGADGDYRLGLSGFQLVPSSPALIASFGIPDSSGVIDQEAKTITLNVPFGTDLATLAPVFAVTSGSANQTSGAPPSPTFAAANPVNYVITDDTTDPVTVNSYAVTVVVGPKPPDLTTIVIDLRTGTVIPGASFGTFEATNLPLPVLPTGSILRSIAVDAVLVATNNENYASDFAVLLDPTPDTAGGDFSVGITNGNVNFGQGLTLPWSVASIEDTALIDTKTEADWAAAGVIDLATTGVFLGNAFGSTDLSGTWSGTVTLSFDLVDDTGDDTYNTWAGGEPFDGDKNGDGVPNGLAFLLGAASPDANALGLLPLSSRSPQGLVLTFSMLNAANRGSAIANVQWSNDLGATDLWVGNTAAVPETSGTANSVSFIITPNGDLNDVEATIPSAESANGKLFGRIEGSQE